MNTLEAIDYCFGNPGSKVRSETIKLELLVNQVILKTIERYLYCKSDVSSLTKPCELTPEIMKVIDWKVI